MEERPRRTADEASPATARTVLRFGETEVTIDVPVDIDRYVDAAALLRDADAPEPPYWLHLWTGSRALARAVAARGDWHGLRVADVGCGLGLAGLVAARLGARVVFVDHVHAALRLALANAATNGCEARALQTDALRPGLRGDFDAVLLADVTYDPALQEALATFLSEHLAPHGVGLCAESVRNHDPGFHRACERLGLRLSETEVRELDEGRPAPVRLTEVRR